MFCFFGGGEVFLVVLKRLCTLAGQKAGQEFLALRSELAKDLDQSKLHMHRLHSDPLTYPVIKCPPKSALQLRQCQELRSETLDVPRRGQNEWPEQRLCRLAA